MILSEKKATPEFFEGDTGGRGQKWLEESGYKKFTIFFKLTDTTGIIRYHTDDFMAYKIVCSF